MHYVLELQASVTDHNLVGGKAANLHQLLSAGLRVPPGFVLTTAAYRSFVAANQLQPLINQVLDGLPDSHPQTFEQASTTIRRLFADGALPQELRQAILNGYAQYSGMALAVRSSATVEDLPQASFAGQQDTFLNILGEQALLEAIVRCWSSLWTARAIAYRRRQQIADHGAALAVICQVMVPAEISGVLFSANPLSGARGETVIDAIYGLGEALVSGQVEPDHFVLESASGKLLSRRLGDQQSALHPSAAGGLQTQLVARTSQSVLNPAELAQLVGLGRQITDLFGFPQDIEWAIASGTCFVLQSRPITSLYPLPRGMPAEPLQVLFSFASVQGVQDPLTPLGQDVIRLLFSGAAEWFGYPVNHREQGAILIAGERLWGNMTAGLRNPLGRRMIPRFFGMIDPPAAAILQPLIADAAPGLGKFRLRTVIRLGRAFFPLLRQAWRVMRKPAGFAQAAERRAEQILEDVRGSLAGKPADLPTAVEAVLELRLGFVHAFPTFLPGILPGLLSMNLLTRIARNLGADRDLVLKMTRGLPFNVTTEMDLQLWQIAQGLRESPQTLQPLQQSSPQELAAGYRRGALPPALQAPLAEFMARYAARGLAEIDIGRRRWSEDPAYILQVLQGYLRIDEAQQAPDRRFEEGSRAAEQALEELAEMAGGRFPGRLRQQLVRALYRRLRELAGLRESPKFLIIRLMGITRQILRETGAQLAAAGRIEDAEDLFFLNFDQLRALAGGEIRDWKRLIKDRQAAYQREMLRSRLPRLLLSDGRAFYEAKVDQDAAEGMLSGSPVSPGKIEGRVRLVHDPLQAALEPGEILVCVGTDPAWTPLFLSAGGLVMEIGGMMTHGAIVAREYGLPAVVGVQDATRRLRTGQRVRLDGSSGQIEIIDQP